MSQIPLGAARIGEVLILLTPGGRRPIPLNSGFVASLRRRPLQNWIEGDTGKNKQEWPLQ